MPIATARLSACFSRLIVELDIYGDSRLVLCRPRVAVVDLGPNRYCHA